MFAWHRLVERLTGRADRDLERELRVHLDLEAEQQQNAGLPPEEAVYAAQRAFGNTALIKENTRAMWGWNSLEGFVRDIRYGLRLLGRSPVFTLFAVASLALGIGATSAIFALFDAIVLRELPVREPEQLVLASFARPGRDPNYSLPYPHFDRMRKFNSTLDGLFATYPIGRINVAFKGEPELAEGMYASGDYYATLGLQPALGRLFSGKDDHPGNTIAVLSYGYWQTRFGGSPAVVGSGITINQVPFTIIGVEPWGFRGVEVGRTSDITVPMRTRDILSESKPLWDDPRATWVYVMGRLKQGVPLEQAHQELSLIVRQVYLDVGESIPRLRPAAERMAREVTLRLESGAGGVISDLREKYQRWLRLVLMVLGVVLLLATLNVATLLLSRSEVRRREIATRLALGAGRGRIVRQLLTESVMLAGFGGILGLMLAAWGSRALLALAMSGAERLPVPLTLDLRITAFTVAVSAATCLIFGLIPALRSTSREGIASPRQVGSNGRRLLDRGLVAIQVALSLTVLVIAGLSIRTLANLWVQETGYDRSNVLMFSVDAKLTGKKGGDVPATYESILDELHNMPGARAVSLSAVRPVSGTYYFVDVVTKIGERTLPDDQHVRVATNSIGPAYFTTLSIPMLAGRDFDRRDYEGAPKVAIISERMARHFTGNPVGQRIGREEVREVVGVVKDTRYARIKDAPREVVYVPIFQGDPNNMWYAPTFEIRYSGAVADIVRAARETVARAAPDLKLFDIKTLEVQTKESLTRERLLALLTSYLGGFALLLACLGLYGLMNYAVTQRTPELGLRMALGARPASVRWQVLRASAAPVLAGVIAGLLGTYAAVQLIESQLFGVQPHDPTSVVLATLLLLVMAFVASYVPAFRASRIDPMTALRHE